MREKMDDSFELVEDIEENESESHMVGNDNSLKRTRFSLL